MPPIFPSVSLGRTFQVNALIPFYCVPWMVVVALLQDQPNRVGDKDMFGPSGRGQQGHHVLWILEQSYARHIRNTSPHASHLLEVHHTSVGQRQHSQAVTQIEDIGVVPCDLIVVRLWVMTNDVTHGVSRSGTAPEKGFQLLQSMRRLMAAGNCVECQLAHSTTKNTMSIEKTQGTFHDNVAGPCSTHQRPDIRNEFQCEPPTGDGRGGKGLVATSKQYVCATHKIGGSLLS